MVNEIMTTEAEIAIDLTIEILESIELQHFIMYNS